MMTPFSEAVVEVLKNLIAPGDRMRLSPMVEETQLLTLFGESAQVNPRRRYESIRQILSVPENQQCLQELAQVFMTVLNTGSPIRYEIAYEDEEYRLAWLTHNFTMNVCKVQMRLIDLVKHGLLSDELTVIDVGIGAGNAPIALFDFLIAWGCVCHLYNLELPITRVRYYGFDKIQGWCELTQKVLDAYASVLDKRIQIYREYRGDAAEQSALTQVRNWMRNCVVERRDMQDEDFVDYVRQIQGEKTLFILCNVVSELLDQGKQNLVRILGQLPNGSSAIIIEPGDERRSKALFALRSRFLRSEYGAGWAVVAPCGQEYGNQPPDKCGRCWNLQRSSLHHTQLYRWFMERCREIQEHRRGSKVFDEYENDLLSQSYTVLFKGTLSAPSRYKDNRELTRYIGKLPTSGALKLCPACHPDSRVTSLCLQPRPGYVPPRVEFGDVLWLKQGAFPVTSGVESVTIQIEDNDVLLADSSSIRGAERVRNCFLPEYTERTRLAIDELAYRFFGFEKMHDFQHEVLSHVLRGRSIFAIAATGGGKSECFILPALLLPGVTVVVAPLKSLMQDQYEQRLSERYGLGDISTFINGDVPFQERDRRLQRMRRGYYKIVYFTPEQLERDYVLAALRDAHESVGVSFLALDEAHCISQWGHDFRPSYLNIITKLDRAGIDPIPVRIALTATASPRVREDVCRQLHLDPRPVQQGGDLYVHSSNRPELNFIVKFMQNTEEKINDILMRIRTQRQSTPDDALIVFMPLTGKDPNQTNWDWWCQEERRLQKRHSFQVTLFASFLEEELGERVCLYHGKMDENEEHSDAPEPRQSTVPPLGNLSGRYRKGEQLAFIRGERAIMVATKGFGMGIDKPNIRLVIHRTPPGNLEAYIQEAGRAGRDGNFADVVLYFSPDTVVDPDSPERSDRSIQEHFIQSKYIRRIDVEAVCAFLQRCTRTVNGALYFTNDEVMGFLESIPEYKWPEFPPREKGERESEEHAKILDRGHIYANKRDYIKRILEALYSFRPQGRALITRCQTVEIQIIKPEVLNARGIVDSNYYYGEILRQQNVSPEELQRLIESAKSEEGIIPLAKRLGLTLFETHAMLRDIKMTSGRRVNGQWIPDLLDFKAIFAPGYGPAQGKTRTLSEWRDYAGCRKRNTKKTADDLARKNRRSVPSLDDWFDWSTTNQRVGWEVELGEAFQSDEALRELIDAFMEEHDQRQRDDWQAYEYLLNDYIGINSEGKGPCLRAVILGYLKTNEVVVGNNCYSCSRCVPDENFSQDMALRRSVVRTLADRVSLLLDEIERQYRDAFAPEAILVELWQLSAEETSRGSNVYAYIQGWSGRVLTDTPEHKSAHLIRLQAMSQGVWNISWEEYLYHLGRLLRMCDPHELTHLQEPVEYLFHHYDTLEEALQRRRALEIMLEFYHQTEQAPKEYELLKLYLQEDFRGDRLERFLDLYRQLPEPELTNSELIGILTRWAGYAPLPPEERKPVPMEFLSLVATKMNSMDDSERLSACEKLLTIEPSREVARVCYAQAPAYSEPYVKSLLVLVEAILTTLHSREETTNGNHA
ncbi:MAG: DEAD/DEAH box helicase [Fimbriimonadales bacterium]|nr:DEAD/DEAH box helicase [Fimbriimonadales bacterium]